MTIISPLLMGLFLAVFVAGTAYCGGEKQGDLSWPEITSDCKPWAYWWWMGSAVDDHFVDVTEMIEIGKGGQRPTFRIMDIWDFMVG